MMSRKLAAPYLLKIKFFWKIAMRSQFLSMTSKQNYIAWLKLRCWCDNVGQGIQEWTKQNLWKTAFKKFEGISSVLGRPYQFKFFKGYLPQILLLPFLNTLFHMYDPSFLKIWLNSQENTCVRRLWHGRFPVNFSNLLRHLSQRTTSGYWFCGLLKLIYLRRMCHYYRNHPIDLLYNSIDWFQYLWKICLKWVISTL